MRRSLEGKNAAVYGGGGAVGGASARAFAREGARVFLASRTRTKLEAVARDIRKAGGTVETAEVDALDEQDVQRHAEAVAGKAGSIDIALNAVGITQKAASPFFPGFWNTRGWGFGVSIITQRDELAHVPERYGWEGGYGTSFYCDPREDLIGILMTQRVWDSPSVPAVLQDFWNTAYAAIED
jgi:NAD(P)-dependent dehydrogenase (short-subunit alcohol dehydrogenase family)